MGIEQPVWVRSLEIDRFLEAADQMLRVALQPIVDAHSGEVLAHESFVRGFDDIGFPHPAALFDHAASMRRLFELETCLITKAMTAKAAMPQRASPLLFINLDGRNLARARELRAFIEVQCDLLDLKARDICIELSETHRRFDPDAFAEAVDHLRGAGFMIAIDDFGTGVSGLQMLHQARPDFLKIERFFIESLARDATRRLLVSSIVDLAHTLGSRVIAEGVETIEELVSCRKAHCDLVQGFLITRPSVDVTALEPSYSEVLARAPVPPANGDEIAIETLLEEVAVLSDDTTLADLFEVTAENPDQSVFPMIDTCGLPRGAVRERDIKPLIYSLYGRELARNRAIRLGVQDYVQPIATLESTTPLGPRLELIADRAGDGVIVTRSLQYQGYLSATSLLKLANEIRVRQAAAQNPLTRLPGNNAVQEFLDRCIESPEQCRVAAYLDIDNFKPFNDKYGFEIGDRAILMMASILKSLERDHSVFVGHIGGDDFFLGCEGPACDATADLLARIGERFRHVAESLYNADDREAGYIVGRARDGRIRRFPLLASTIAAVRLPEGYRPASTLEMTQRMTALKAEARRTGQSYLSAELGPVREH
ncbi:diguanylate cyclase/phosphodiesterase [Rhodovulum sp. ES.010]|uniref:bifunctional diguanylate cyclase/phosphodiesterase n=1 Tax=Rhodovulum sp. ES.010 TaxID=1882821 RepID=UPI000927DDB3|nr:bifunctional diguanylate cyclase/phosphodiesterase [Rhodovulum sp. ES.010]SIO28274.1 diguanylate cyclase/phosphodiesterase [Rhodovulum sp. ES.010]